MIPPAEKGGMREISADINSDARPDKKSTDGFNGELIDRRGLREPKSPD
jgi:hypothetical protein